jgi:hypothetical protein
LQLNPNFSLAQVPMAWRCPLRALAGAHEAAQRAIRLSPRDPSCAIYYAVAAYAQFCRKKLLRRPSSCA